MLNEAYRTMVSEIIDNGMLCAGRIVNISYYALQSSSLPGNPVELGCHRGFTAALICLLTGKTIYVYDSFEGLPERSEQDAGSLEHFKRGALAVSADDVYKRFERYKLPEPFVKKVWFNQITADVLPAAISFAHLDADLYQSIKDGLEIIYPRLVPGGVCIIDDYGWNGTRGVKLAADEYMLDKPEKIIPLKTGSDQGYHAIITKT